MEEKNKDTIKNIDVFKELVQKMSALEEDKHSIVYNLYKVVFTNNLEKLTLDELINCYAEIEIINKDLAAIILHEILVKIDGMNDEELNLLEEFLVQKETGLEEFKINLWAKIDPQINEEINKSIGSLWDSKRLEIADKYNEIYKNMRINNNIHRACLKIKEYCENLKDEKVRKQEKSSQTK